MTWVVIKEIPALERSPLPKNQRTKGSNLEPLTERGKMQDNAPQSNKRPGCGLVAAILFFAMLNFQRKLKLKIKCSKIFFTSPSSMSLSWICSMNLAGRKEAGLPGEAAGCEDEDPNMPNPDSTISDSTTTQDKQHGTKSRKKHTAGSTRQGWFTQQCPRWC